MSSQRSADAENAPYLTHIVTHHGQITLVPADNNGRVRQPQPATTSNPKGNRSRQRQERNTRDEEIRFNVGPRSLRSTTGNRALRRGDRQERSRNEIRSEVSCKKAYPDYPPPSFLEATSPNNATSQSSSVAPDATLPVALPSHPPTLSGLPSENDADSETSSLEIVDMDSVPAQQHLPSGAKLEENIKRDWMNRRGVEFPSPAPNVSRGRSKGRSTRAVLDSDSDDAPEPQPAATARQSGSKSKSLSPLRTLFPYRSMAVDQPSSASPNPSPYSSPSSSPFLSATSLKMSMSTTSISSIKGEGFFSRRFLSFKGKERAKESIDSWEVVDSHSDPSLVSDNHSSPTRSQSFTYGMPFAPTQAVKELTPPTPVTAISTHTEPHPLSLRDRKAPPVPVVTRPRRKAPDPPPKPPQLACVPQGPILTSVRTRNPPQPPRKPSHLASSPLVRDIWRPSSQIDLDTESNSVLHRAIITPLPLSPVDGNPRIVPLSPTIPARPGRTGSSSASIQTPIPTSASASGSSQNVPFDESISIPQTSSSDFCHMPGEYPFENNPPPPISVRSPSPVQSTRRHYPGRPLPQPPSATRSLIDSAYGNIAQEEFPASAADLNPCPEGLLIDLGDSFTSGMSINVPPTPTANPGALHLMTPSYATSSSSSVDLLTSIADDEPPVIAEERPNHMGSDSSPLVRPNARPALFSEVTDLDVLVSRISEEENQEGLDYDALLLLSEFIGPASPPRRSTPSALAVNITPRLASLNPPPTTSTAVTERSPSSPNVPLLGNVRVDRRRTTKDGRVKLKLGLLDATVDKCGICLTQFREGDSAQTGIISINKRSEGKGILQTQIINVIDISFSDHTIIGRDDITSEKSKTTFHSDRPGMDPVDRIAALHHAGDAPARTLQQALELKQSTLLGVQRGHHLENIQDHRKKVQ
ncbi:hypothetical protein H0H93_007777 [Arthromyces matolae]|nr:hypothetical protein H0H93_007777 [Arthromyces matolae]